MQANGTTASPTLTILDTLTRHLKQTKQAYYANLPGVTYDDMAKAAERVLTFRALYERESGRKVTSQPTKKQIAALLR
jgi:hypothetical protein